MRGIEDEFGHGLFLLKEFSFFKRVEQKQQRLTENTETRVWRSKRWVEAKLQLEEVRQNHDI